MKQQSQMNQRCFPPPHAACPDVFMWDHFNSSLPFSHMLRQCPALWLWKSDFHPMHGGLTNAGPIRERSFADFGGYGGNYHKTMKCQIMVGNAVFVFLWLKLFFSFTRGQTWHEVTQYTCHNWWNCHTWLNVKCVKIYGCIPTEIQPHLEAAEINKNTRINKDYCMEKDVFLFVYT